MSGMGVIMKEKIGNITLDYEYYPGEDLYSDGDVEEEILEIVKNYGKEEFPRIIEERASWPVLYHLSPFRENIVDWIPIEKEMKVLEVGSGCGAITGALAKKAGSVTCIDLSKKRSLINAYRNAEYDNVTIHVGNFQDIEKVLDTDFDYIFLIGVFEYAQGYIGTDKPYERFMEILLKHLKGEGADGRLVIAIENKFGLKYWAGCKEDHQGLYFSGLEDYPEDTGVRTFTRNGLERVCKANRCEEYSFYYPYPDYKFMTSVYSDEYLPRLGELCTNIRNFDRSRLLLFDEKNVFDTIIKEGLFPLYANSYCLVVGKPLSVKFSKYSNDRSPEYAIRTDIRLPESGPEQAGISGGGKALKTAGGAAGGENLGLPDPVVEKRACSPKAQTHIEAMEKAHELLVKRYEGSALSVNECRKMPEGGLAFAFAKGRTLEELFDELLDRQDFEGIEKLFGEYVRRIGYREGAGVTDYDLIFSNILVEGDRWTVIDYEWTVQEDIPVKEVAYRALYCYALGAAKRKKAEERLLSGIFPVSEEERERVLEREKEMQKKIAGERMSLGLLRNLIGNPVLNPLGLSVEGAEESGVNLVQVYEDTGDGFSEANSFMLNEKKGALKKQAEKGRENITFTLHFAGERKAVRIDPDHGPCLVTIENAFWNGQKLPLKGRGKFATNGKALNDGVLAFPKEDPNFTFYLKHLPMKEDNILEVSMNVAVLPESIAGRMV